ncbi:MAG: gamma-glutamyltransferase, partial [Hyphomicrobiales bacterium]|nr:gamma-glutamyltransferase [Hyphomicrobiales bacterium]
MTRFAFLRCTCAAALAVILLLVEPTNAQHSRDNYNPAPAGTLEPVAARHGMVVAQERLSAEVGVDVMSRGGNAVDAAVATGFAMAVTYPRAGNIGGGGFMVIHTAKGETVSIDYRETAPAAATRDMFLGSDGKPDIAKSRDSALGIGIPGTVAGLALALEKYGSGKFTLSDLLQPAIALAREGFVIADDGADTLPDWHRRLARWPSSKPIFSRADG